MTGTAEAPVESSRNSRGVAFGASTGETGARAIAGPERANRTRAIGGENGRMGSFRKNVRVANSLEEENAARGSEFPLREAGALLGYL